MEHFVIIALFWICICLAFYLAERF
jgi:hypothetical protein